MSERFRTLKGRAEGIYREKGSKFLGFAEPVHTRTDAQERVEALKQEHPNASHHCSAYSIGVDEPFRWEQDDGEPQGTAGRPIMNAIRSEGLDNVLITVVRYFGGTKLGKRGLIDAYRAAAEDALAHGRIVEERVLTWLRIEYPHESTGKLEALLRNYGAEQREAEYAEEVSVRIGIPPSDREGFIQDMKGIKGARVRGEE